MENNRFDIIIIGAGPAGIFAALQITEKRPDSRVLIMDTGRAISHRTCPARQTASVCIATPAPSCMVGRARARSATANSPAD